MLTGSGDGVVQIFRYDNKTMLQLMPSEKMYMEHSLEKAAAQNKGKDMSQWDFEETVMGEEVLNGMKVTKYKAIATSNDGKKYGGFSWRTKEGLTVKHDLLFKEGTEKKRIITELKNVKVGRQDPQLFEAPKDFTKFDMAGMMGGMMGNRMGREGMDQSPMLFFIFSTWNRGRQLLRTERTRSGIALEPFLKSLETYPPIRIEGTAVFMAGSVDRVPRALLHNLKHNRVMHERVIFLTAVPHDVPHVDPEDCAEIRELGDGCYLVKIDRGFKDSYDIADIAQTLDRHFDFQIVTAETSFFLSRESAVTGHGGMAACRAAACSPG